MNGNANLYCLQKINEIEKEFHEEKFKHSVITSNNIAYLIFALPVSWLRSFACV